ncbi:MAG: tagaturonate reductase [Phaeodactylibacter sp.]|uniref:tagaturonate reductase n=1 Tax=Phaeodactylibacter sp. TaxID=1940289 RepID=UPI0032EF9F89
MKLLGKATVGLQTAHPIRILQFGGGNFLRAFADYLIEILNTEAGFDAGVALVKPTERGDYTALRKQDGLFQVLTEGIHEGKAVQEINRVHCIQQIIHPYQDWPAYVATAALPQLRFVLSNTTESGIAFREEPMVPGRPAQEFPGKLTQWLYHRFTHFDGAADKGCIVLPCELIEENGQQLKACILQYAAHWQLGVAFETWIDAHNIFCNTLVDRIVPGAPPQPEPIWAQTGLEDHQLVTAEPYLLWAIEAPVSVREELPFGQTRQNVVFTDDLSTYRTLKVRLLNGAHTAMVPVGLSHGITTVREFVEHPDWGPWLIALLKEEVAPTLPYSPETISAYIETIIDRFRNPYIHHKLADIALNSISKFKVRLLPTALAYHAQTGQAPPRIAASLMALLELYKGEYSGLPRDQASVVTWFQQEWANNQREALVGKALSNTDLWGQDIRFMAPAVLQG